MLHPGDGEVIVRVVAAGVNRPDVMQRQGRYPAPAGASDLPRLTLTGSTLRARMVAQKAEVADAVRMPACDVSSCRRISIAVWRALWSTIT